jgi:hypothetical protein
VIKATATNGRGSGVQQVLCSLARVTFDRSMYARPAWPMELSDTISIDSESEPTRRETAPYLFLLLECERPTAGSSRHSLTGVDQVLIGRGHTRTVSRDCDGLRRALLNE